MKFEKNIGKKNRAARLAIGIILAALSLYYYDNSILPVTGLILGGIFILESVFSYCVLHGIKGTKDMR